MTHRKETLLPGIYLATPDAQATIHAIEAEVTAYYAGDDVDIADVLDRALSLAGLGITVSSDDNVACIQAVWR